MSAKNQSSSWIGKPLRKDRGNTYYKGLRITVNTTESLIVYINDDIMLKTTSEEVWVARCMGLFEDKCGERYVQLQWYYRLHELPSALRRLAKQQYAVSCDEVIMSDVIDSQNICTIFGRAVVIRGDKSTYPPTPRSRRNVVDHYFYCRLHYSSKEQALTAVDSSGEVSSIKATKRPEFSSKTRISQAKIRQPAADDPSCSETSETKPPASNTALVDTTSDAAQSKNRYASGVKYEEGGTKEGAIGCDCRGDDEEEYCGGRDCRSNSSSAMLTTAVAHTPFDTAAECVSTAMQARESVMSTSNSDSSALQFGACVSSDKTPQAASINRSSAPVGTTASSKFSNGFSIPPLAVPLVRGISETSLSEYMLSPTSKMLLGTPGTGGSARSRGRGAQAQSPFYQTTVRVGPQYQAELPELLSYPQQQLAGHAAPPLECQCQDAAVEYDSTFTSTAARVSERLCGERVSVAEDEGKQDEKTDVNVTHSRITVGSSSSGAYGISPTSTTGNRIVLRGTHIPVGAIVWRVLATPHSVAGSGDDGNNLTSNVNSLRIWGRADPVPAAAKVEAKADPAPAAAKVEAKAEVSEEEDEMSKCRHLQQARAAMMEQMKPHARALCCVVATPHRAPEAAVTTEEEEEEEEEERVLEGIYTVFDGTQFWRIPARSITSIVFAPQLIDGMTASAPGTMAAKTTDESETDTHHPQAHSQRSIYIDKSSPFCVEKRNPASSSSLVSGAKNVLPSASVSANVLSSLSVKADVDVSNQGHAAPESPSTASEFVWTSYCVRKLCREVERVHTLMAVTPVRPAFPNNHREELWDFTSDIPTRSTAVHGATPIPTRVTRTAAAAAAASRTDSGAKIKNDGEEKVHCPRSRGTRSQGEKNEQRDEGVNRHSRKRSYSVGATVADVTDFKTGSKLPRVESRDSIASARTVAAVSLTSPTVTVSPTAAAIVSPTRSRRGAGTKTTNNNGSVAACEASHFGKAFLEDDNNRLENPTLRPSEDCDNKNKEEEGEVHDGDDSGSGPTTTSSREKFLENLIKQKPKKVDPSDPSIVTEAFTAAAMAYGRGNFQDTDLVKELTACVRDDGSSDAPAPSALWNSPLLYISDLMPWYLKSVWMGMGRTRTHHRNRSSRGQLLAIAESALSEAEDVSRGAPRSVRDALSGAMAILGTVVDVEGAGVRDLKAVRLPHVIDFFHRIYNPHRMSGGDVASLVALFEMSELILLQQRYLLRSTDTHTSTDDFAFYPRGAFDPQLFLAATTAAKETANDAFQPCSGLDQFRCCVTQLPAEQYIGLMESLQRYHVGLQGSQDTYSQIMKCCGDGNDGKMHMEEGNKATYGDRHCLGILRDLLRA